MRNKTATHASPAEKSIHAKSIAGAASYFFRTLLVQGIGLVSVLVLSYYFSPEDFGLYGLVIQVIGILVFFSDIGLAATLVQKEEEPTLEEYRLAFTIQQLLSWAIVLVIIGLYQVPILQDRLGQVGFLILLSLGFSFPLAALKTIPSVMLERRLAFSKLVIPQIVEQVVFHAVLIALAISDFGVLSYAPAILARSISGVLVLASIQWWPIGFSFHFSKLKSLLGFGVKFQLNDFLARIKDQLFYLVLVFFLSPREFGYIQWAKSWSMYPYNLTVQNIMAVTFPAFSRLQNDKKALAKGIESSLFFITLVIFPIIVGMCVFIIPTLRVFTEYSKWLPAASSLIFFTLSIGWSALSSPLTNALNAIGEINKTLQLMIMWTVLVWVVTPLFVWWQGYQGVALAAFVISWSSALSVTMLKRFVPFHFLETFWRQLVAAGCMALVGMVGWGWWSQGVGQLLFGMMLLACTYMVVFWIVGNSKLRQEISLLKE
ncbi:MAG: oligosaccharide flippase family protein [Pseudomonadales bacterium]|nr:oligosaccharide flippase family protein [Pseudomonadales bacterium]